MLVNNETGCVHPVKEIGAIAAKYNAVFFCDCVQAPLYYNLAPVENGIHYLSLSAHKLYGPKGVGMLYVRKDREKHALWKGGMQERAWRPGTENVMGIAGFATAWEHALQNREGHTKDVLSIRSAAVDALRDIPGIQFTGKNTAPHILHFSFPSTLSAETILLKLDMKGIALSAGSACQSGSHRASHVVEALGKSSDDVHLRMSFGFMNQREEVIEACKALLI